MSMGRNIQAEINAKKRLQEQTGYSCDHIIFLYEIKMGSKILKTDINKVTEEFKNEYLEYTQGIEKQKQIRLAIKNPHLTTNELEAYYKANTKLVDQLSPRIATEDKTREQLLGEIKPYTELLILFYTLLIDSLEKASQNPHFLKGLKSHGLSIDPIDIPTLIEVYSASLKQQEMIKKAITNPKLSMEDLKNIYIKSKSFIYYITEYVEILKKIDELFKRPTVRLMDDLPDLVDLTTTEQKISPARPNHGVSTTQPSTIGKLSEFSLLSSTSPTSSISPTKPSISTPTSTQEEQPELQNIADRKRVKKTS